jgi:hypothetical protein
LSISEETISQYKLKSNALIKELVAFTTDFNDDEDEPNLLEKIKKASETYMITDDQIADLQAEIDRVVKMFYL